MHESSETVCFAVNSFIVLCLSLLGGFYSRTVYCPNNTCYSNRDTNFACVAQLAEALHSEWSKCWFESSHRHHFPSCHVYKSNGLRLHEQDSRSWRNVAWKIERGVQQLGVSFFSRFARVAIETLSYGVFAWSDSKSRHYLRGWTSIDWQNLSCAYACSGAWHTLNSSKRLNGEDSYLAAAWSTRSIRQHVMLKGHPQVSTLHNNQAERP